MSENNPRLIQGPGINTVPPRAVPQQVPQQNIINMLNDMQLIALIAAQIKDPDPKVSVSMAEDIVLEVVGRDMAHSTAHQQVRIDGCFKCAFIALKEHYDTAMQINSDAREKASRGE